jgi:hypothetical protein
MKRLPAPLTAIAILLSTQTGFTGDTIAGTWIGKLTPAQGRSIEIEELVFKEDGTVWSGEIKLRQPGSLSRTPLRALSVRHDAVSFRTTIWPLVITFHGNVRDGTIDGTATANNGLHTATGTWSVRRTKRY